MLQTKIWDKYNSLHFIFVFFIHLSYHSFCCKDQFTALILKFGMTRMTGMTGMTGKTGMTRDDW